MRCRKKTDRKNRLFDIGRWTDGLNKLFGQAFVTEPQKWAAFMSLSVFLSFHLSVYFSFYPSNSMLCLFFYSRLCSKAWMLKKCLKAKINGSFISHYLQSVFFSTDIRNETEKKTDGQIETIDNWITLMF